MSRNRLPPGQQLAAAGKWPVVGERSPAESTAPWTVTVSGLVDRPRTWTLAELATLPQVVRTLDIHCVTRWSKFDVRFGGVLLEDVLKQSVPSTSARYLSFVARSPRQHSTSLPLDEALGLETLLATTADDQLLTSEHGGPIRTVVPGKYFYKSLKWLTEIRVLDRDELGFWEGKAGYHNEADPWREQRYVAANLNRLQVAKAFTQRNFAGLEFQGLEARGITLEGLNAAAAVLRNADFRQARLPKANFERANLSNARFEQADLREASFRNADVEGADFSGADLRGCDFRGASLLGVTFVGSRDGAAAASPAAAAIVDSTTRFDAAQFDQLFDVQAAYLRSQLV